MSWRLGSARVGSNYAFNATPEQALRSNRAVLPARVNAALALIGGSVVRKSFTIALCCLLAACATNFDASDFASAEEQANARGHIETLRSGDFENLEMLLDSAIRTPDVRETFKRMAELIPAGTPESVELVGAQRSQNDDVRELNLTFEYSIEGKWLLINVAVRTDSVGTKIFGLNVLPQSASLSSQHQFTLVGKSPLQYTVLILAIVVPMLSLLAAGLCTATRLKGRKWVWLAFILVGFGSFSVNWSTGQWFIAPLSMQLLGISAFAPMNGPWTIAVSLPIGAIVFLLFRERLKRHGSES